MLQSIPTKRLISASFQLLPVLELPLFTTVSLKKKDDQELIFKVHEFISVILMPVH